MTSGSYKYLNNVKAKIDSKNQIKIVNKKHANRSLNLIDQLYR